MIGRWFITDSQDHISVVSPNEQLQGAFEGQKFYVGTYAQAGTYPVYRTYNAQFTDHMDSLTQGEGAYAFDFTLGHAFDSPREGMQPIFRWYDSIRIDHLSAQTSDPETTGYSMEGLLGYAFPRYGSLCNPNLTLTYGEVTLSLNKAAGGAVDGLIWNGKQFVNRFDYGRLIQTAFNLTNNAEEDNPTEAGSRYSCPGSALPEWSQGSPLASIALVGSCCVTTKTYPLQWIPENHGGDDVHPVIWDGFLQRGLQMGYGGDPRVVQWVQAITFPDTESYLDMELIAAYLTDEFNQFYTYNAATDNLTSLNLQLGQVVPKDGVQCLDPNDAVTMRPAKGGAIAATADGLFALGVYRNHPTNKVGVCKITQGSGGDPTTRPSASKLIMFQRDNTGGIASGSHTWTAYLVVGTLSQVKNSMQKLAKILFADGFESGNTANWSFSLP